MADYTSLSQTEVAQLLFNYDLGEVLDSSPLAGGRANSSLVVRTTSGRFVLSVCDEKSFGEIELLTNCLAHLGDREFPTTRLVKTTDGGKYIRLGDKPVYLKEYLEGVAGETLSEPQARAVGQALAGLNLIEPPAGIPDAFAYGIQCFGEIDPVQHEQGRWLAEVSPLIASALSPELPKGLIHGDLFADNILFDGDRLVAILDFEEACRYPLVFDLGMCLVGCCRRDSRLVPELCRALVGGYEAVRPLLPLEKRVLQAHVIYGAAATSFWRYRQYHIRHPHNDQADAYREMRDLAQWVREHPPERFLTEYLP